MLKFLNEKLKEGLKYININFLYEIRIRENKPTMINYKEQYLYLTSLGISNSSKNAIVLNSEDIENIVFNAGEYSVYSVEEQIKKGFITTKEGVRIGLAGSYVLEKGSIITIRDYSSLCIRIPHEINNSGVLIYNICLKDELNNILIMAPPGIGKTTILRDLSRLISENYLKNILIIDERGEISKGNTGTTSDIILYADKSIAIENGIRSLRPDIIITDELSEKDNMSIRKAVISGVKIIASTHINSIDKIREEKLDIFDKYVLLDSTKIGKIFAIYDENLNEVYKN